MRLVPQLLYLCSLLSALVVRMAHNVLGTNIYKSKVASIIYLPFKRTLNLSEATLNETGSTAPVSVFFTFSFSCTDGSLMSWEPTYK